MKDTQQNSIEIYDNKINIKDIINKSNLDSYEEALYVCDLSDIINKYYTWKSYMPRVIPFYAVKCNDHPIVIKLLAKLGTGFDCASKGEIKKVIGLGIEPKQIIFANPTKLTSHLSFASVNGVESMTFDNDFELYKIHRFYPQARLVLRIRCEAEKAQCPLGQKFGCDPEDEAPSLILLAKSLNLTLIGISFHVGSGCMDFPVYERAISAARKLFDYAEEQGYKLYLLDIGGGFPGDKGTSIVEVSEIVNRALDTYFPNTNDVTVISEPGRFFVSSAYTLICKIHSKKELYADKKIDKIMYYLNDGVYGSFNCILYDHQMAIPKYFKNSTEKLYRSSIWGPTCDALDQICEDVYIPKMDIGELLMFENMGAYTLPVASPFNGFPLPRIKFFIDTKDEEILEWL